MTVRRVMRAWNPDFGESSGVSPTSALVEAYLGRRLKFASGAASLGPAYFATFGWIAAVLYSKAYDVPHQLSTRTRIIIFFGSLVPGLFFLQLQRDKSGGEPEPPG